MRIATAFQFLQGFEVSLLGGLGGAFQRQEGVGLGFEQDGGHGGLGGGGRDLGEIGIEGGEVEEGGLHAVDAGEFIGGLDHELDEEMLVVVLGFKAFVVRTLGVLKGCGILAGQEGERGG